MFVYNFVQLTNSRPRRWINLLYYVVVLSKWFTSLTHSARSWASRNSSVKKPSWLSARVSLIYVVQMGSMDKLVTVLFHRNWQFFVIKSIRCLNRFKAINTLQRSKILSDRAIKLGHNGACSWTTVLDTTCLFLLDWKD